MEGVVKSYSVRNGYGFIDCKGVDYFFTFKDIMKKRYPMCERGEHVTFIPCKSGRGYQAKEVHSK